MNVAVDATSLPASAQVARTDVMLAVTSIARESVLSGGLNREMSPVPAGTPAMGQERRTAYTPPPLSAVMAPGLRHELTSVRANKAARRSFMSKAGPSEDSGPVER